MAMISLRGVGKSYARRGRDRPWSLRRLEPVHALTDITFDVEPGTSLGVLGRNGAGKSTLLKLVAGTLEPTRGEITVAGRVAPLLQLGAGFDPRLTGSENVHLSAAFYGLTRSRAAALLPMVRDFADIGDGFDDPIRTYSTGMRARLGFAVAAHLDADVVLIDEALAVGDGPFRQKCRRRTKELIESGATVMITSHAAGLIKQFCDEAIVLDQGRLRFRGAVDEALDFYRQLE